MHIAITSLPGYTDEEKRMLGRRLKEAASQRLGVQPSMISVSFKDLPYNKWDKFIDNLSDSEIIIPENFRCEDSICRN